ncbi:MAG TPA: hypothetical protein VFJ57_04055 [Solirubrobacterales bacterium]|nr:hypothetical protein [Solirubrobacterales bacterium]
MQETDSSREAERLQRAVLALALDRYPAHLTSRELREEMDDSNEVNAAVRFLVRARLLRWEDEALALTVAALAFDRLSP